MQTYKPTSDIKTNEPMFKKSCICYWRYIRVILREIGQPVQIEIDLVDANDEEMMVRYTLEHNRFVVKVGNRDEICVSSAKMIKTLEQIQTKFEYEFLYAIREFDENKESLTILELAKLGDMTITYGVPAIVPITIDDKESYIKILADKESGKIYTYLCHNEDEPIPFFQAAMYIANNFVDFKLKKQEIYRNIKTGRTAFFSSQENSKILSESKLNSDGSFKRVDLDKNLGQKEVVEKKEGFDPSMLKEASFILQDSSKKRKRRHS